MEDYFQTESQWVIKDHNTDDTCIVISIPLEAEGWKAIYGSTEGNFEAAKSREAGESGSDASTD